MSKVNPPDQPNMETPPPPRPISVLDPLSTAWERMQLVLFQPFSFRKWLAIAFCAWLATLGQGGGGSAQVGGDKATGGRSAEEISRNAERWIRDNFDWLILVVIGVVVLGIALALLFLWLSSRGRFMFLNCVARNRDDVAAPWREYAAQGNSLFWFRLGLAFIMALPGLPLLAVIAFQAYRMLQSQSAEVADFAVIGACVMFAILVGIVYMVIEKFTTDFVTPIMYRRRIKTLEAWRDLRGLMGRSPGSFILYLLFQIVLQMLFAAIVLIALVATCCIIAIPYVGTVILLPLLVFERAYSVCFLEQFGVEYQILEHAPRWIPQPPPPPETGGA